MSSPSSLFSVAGKNVLVTGGSRGIGVMIAEGLQSAGANVLLTSRSEEACREASASIPGSKYVASNVSNRQGCEELAKHVAEVFDNRLDVLINNAGTSWGEPLDRKSGKANWGFDEVFDLNVKGIFYLTRACIPMLENAATKENPSRIINIGSVVGLVPQEAPTHAYDASKAAVHNMTKKFAADLAPKFITVNCLAPGFVPSRMSAGLGTWGKFLASLECERNSAVNTDRSLFNISPGANEEVIAQATPLGRMGNADDMTGACIYFSSKAGSWCTGVILNVDGGAVGGMQIPLSSL
eukprot:scaffold2353_cov134-Cylindrotheca_fusiformis.AAC.11